MRMTDATYASLRDDMKAVVQALVDTGTRLHPAREFDVSSITPRDLWDVLLVVNVDRSHESHPRHDYPGLLPRVLECDGRSIGWLQDRADNGGQDLDDSHIATAFRKMLPELQAVEPSPEVKETAPAPSLPRP